MIAVIVLRYMYKMKCTGQNNPSYYDMQQEYVTAIPKFSSESDGSSLYETVPV